jgi:hypothetical protein
MRCVSFYFERSCPEQRTRAALKPHEPHSSGPWTPGAPAEVLASRGVVVVGSWQAAGVIFVVGKAVLTLHPPLRPLSHNANPWDGAQDMLSSSHWCHICAVKMNSLTPLGPVVLPLLKFTM